MITPHVIGMWACEGLHPLKHSRREFEMESQTRFSGQRNSVVHISWCNLYLAAKIRRVQRQIPEISWQMLPSCYLHRNSCDIGQMLESVKTVLRSSGLRSVSHKQNTISLFDTAIILICSTWSLWVYSHQHGSLHSKVHHSADCGLHFSSLSLRFKIFVGCIRTLLSIYLGNSTALLPLPGRLKCIRKTRFGAVIRGSCLFKQLNSKHKYRNVKTHEETLHIFW